MKRNRLFIIILIPLFLIVAGHSLAAETEPEDYGQCPDFTLKNLDEDNVSLRELLADGPILLDFWATWCKPCKKEMKELQKLHDKYSDQGFKVVTVSLDDGKMASEVSKLIKRHKYTFPVLLDPTQETAQKLGFPGVLPFSLVIDREGTIHHKHIGFNEGDEKKFEAEILPLLTPEATPQPSDAQPDQEGASE